MRVEGRGTNTKITMDSVGRLMDGNVDQSSAERASGVADNSERFRNSKRERERSIRAC
jgi:hypothetical protein